jgi:hypothetical protein
MSMRPATISTSSGEVGAVARPMIEFQTLKASAGRPQTQ